MAKAPLCSISRHWVQRSDVGVQRWISSPQRKLRLARHRDRLGLRGAGEHCVTTVFCSGADGKAYKHNDMLLDKIGNAGPCVMME